MSLPSGTKLGPYELLELVGAGGMGEVYRARDMRLGREVAVKLVSELYLSETFGSGSGTPGTGTPGTPGSGTPGTLSNRRFLREAQSASVLNHPNICTIHDIGEQDGRPYLVMELLRGETLKAALRRGGLSVTDVITFSRQLASALKAAHARGIIHRDIKPANIFVVADDGNKQIKILDFGLAKRQEGDLAESVDGPPRFGQATSADGDAATIAEMDLTSPGSTLGTVAYMSPEQAEGLPLDARTDLFSLGSVIFEMATGRTPFAGSSAAGTLASLLKEEPPSVSFVRAGEGRPPLASGFDAIVAKLLKKDKTQRYQKAADVERDLEPLEAGRTGTGEAFLEASEVHTASTRRAAVATAETTSGNKTLILLAVLALLLLGGGGFAWWKYNASMRTTSKAPDKSRGAGVLPDTIKDSIILANFVNKTGDPVFDDTLNQALRIDLEQSPVIRIVSPEHLRQSVKYLGKPEDTPVTPDIAREIGEREGMKAILTGTIAKLGNDYLITLTAQNTATGDEIASEQVQASDKEHVVDALSKAATAMRAKLGEGLASIRKLNTPFGQATTPSLEAFRAYALGDEAHEKAHDIPEAEGHYKRAIELDPDFAMAYARLGVVYINSGQIAKSNLYFTKAYELSKHVSESERLYIAGHYYQNVTGDMPKVIETLQDSIQVYSGQLQAYINVNVAYDTMGQFDKALPYARKAVELQPEDAIAAENLLQDLLALNRFDEARQELMRERKLGMDDSTSVTIQHVYGSFMLGETKEVERAVAEAVGRPDEFSVTSILAGLQQFSGKYEEASLTFQKAFEQAARAKAPDAQAGILLSNAIGRGLAGFCRDNEAVVKQALALDKSKQTLEFAAVAAAICGNGKMALPLAADLSKKFPQDTLVQDIYLPLSNGFVELAAGNWQKAISSAEPGRPYDMSYPASYVQGLAYLQLHDSGNAINAFLAASSSAIGPVASGIGAPYYAQAQLGLARAYAMAGNKRKAKETYEAFFKTWKDANPDLQMLMAAKKEYAAL